MRHSGPEVQGALLGLAFAALMIFFGVIFPMVMAGSTRGNWGTYALTYGQCWTLKSCDWHP